MTADCSFCHHIEAGTFDVIATGELSLVVADADPVYRGHLVVVPLRHAPDLASLTTQEWTEMALAAQRADLGIREALGTSVEGTNLVMSNGSVADQGVPHAHLHVIPRQEGDGFEFREDAGRYPLPALTEAERVALSAAVSTSRGACPNRGVHEVRAAGRGIGSVSAPFPPS